MSRKSTAKDCQSHIWRQVVHGTDAIRDTRSMVKMVAVADVANCLASRWHHHEGPAQVETSAGIQSPCRLVWNRETARPLLHAVSPAGDPIVAWYIHIPREETLCDRTEGNEGADGANTESRSPPGHPMGQHPDWHPGRRMVDCSAGRPARQRIGILSTRRSVPMAGAV